jgi:hypothetical protein
MSPVSTCAGQRSPHIALIQFGCPTIRVSCDGIHVVAVQIARGEHLHSEHLSVQSVGVPGDPVQHPLGECLLEVLPPTTHGVEFARCVTARIEWHLL